jgi:serine/threonine protein phosphatase PrpC
MCCTDGCYNWIKLDDVDDIVRDKNDSNPAKTIVQKALDNNSNDNITCVIAKVI